jgi:hypothetical protein
MASKRYLITLNDAQQEVLDVLMTEALATSPSAYLASLVVEAWKNKNKKVPRSRSSKEGPEQIDEDARDIPHPDQIFHKGQFLTATELEAWKRLRGEGGDQT